MALDNPRFPHTCRIYRAEFPDPFSQESIETEVYSGMCRSYTRNHTSASGDIITSTRVVAIPVNNTGWKGAYPMTGDIVVVDTGASKEEGIVLDFLPNNFGSDITWRYGRN